MNSKLGQNILYANMAKWWPLVSAPCDYAEEASIHINALLSQSKQRPRTVLELGSGGGNNAYDLKKEFQMTLVDLSPQMIEVSRKLNPDCEHIQGDMREVRLNRVFDAVFIHDAIVYMTNRQQLHQALTTAIIHCRPGGIALLVPDWTKENFRCLTKHGGHDSGDRGIRYLQWTVDSDPTDNLYSNYMLYLMREGNTFTQSDIDEHRCGIFAEQDWIDEMKRAGFSPRMIPYDHSDFEQGMHKIFVGYREA